MISLYHFLGLQQFLYTAVSVIYHLYPIFRTSTSQVEFE